MVAAWYMPAVRVLQIRIPGGSLITFIVMVHCWSAPSSLNFTFSSRHCAFARCCFRCWCFSSPFPPPPAASPPPSRTLPQLSLIAMGKAPQRNASIGRVSPSSRPRHVVRATAFLLLAHLHRAAGQTVAAWDCATYPYPVQILKGTSDSNYRTMQLNLGAGNFEEMWKWTVNTNAHPTGSLNSQAYNVNDGIAYGLFSPSTSGAWNQASYLCRFSHVQNSMVCLCEVRRTFAPARSLRAWHATFEPPTLRTGTAGERRQTALAALYVLPLRWAVRVRLPGASLGLHGDYHARWDLLPRPAGRHQDLQAGGYPQHRVPQRQPGGRQHPEQVPVHGPTPRLLGVACCSACTANILHCAAGRGLLLTARGFALVVRWTVAA